MRAPDDDIESGTDQVHGIAGWRRVVLWPLALLVRLWGSSLRFEVAPADLANMTKRDEPMAIVLWHNRLFLAAEFVRRFRQGRPVYSLVSASKDGAWLDAFFSMVGMRTVRGSDHRLGREAVLALIAKLRAGYDIGITPDGPRGPCYEFKAGALVVTRRAGTPALLLGMRFYSARRLKSWDGFYLPRPFSRVQFRCALMPAAELRDEGMTVELIQQRLRELNPD